jgi:histone-lysine N-methyltransferase SETD7
LSGGSWLYGNVDDIGEFTGDQIAYIYPDLNTALFGKFVNGTMIDASEAKIVGSKCNDDGIKTLTFVKLKGPNYYYDPPSNVSFKRDPLKGDPLDEKYVKINLSKISPTVGDGAFAKTAVPKNTSFSMYTGNVIDRGRDFEELMNPQTQRNKEDKGDKVKTKHGIWPSFSRIASTKKS